MLLYDMIGHVLQMCIKDWEFLFCSLGSYEGRTMIFSVIQGLSLELIYILKSRQMVLYDMIGYVLKDMSV